MKTASKLKQGADAKVADFLELLFEGRNLWQQAWLRVKENHGCAGADGVTIERFESRLPEELGRLKARLDDGSYRPWPLLRLEVEEVIRQGARGRGEVLKRKRRAIRVPTVRDRVVQTAVCLVAGPWIEAQLEPSSFGYRPGLGVRDAVEQIRKWRLEGFEFIVDADIDDFFDSVSHALLFRRLGEALRVPLRAALVRRERGLKGQLIQKVVDDKASAYCGSQFGTAREDARLPTSARQGASPSRLALTQVVFQKKADDLLRRLLGLFSRWVRAEVWDGSQLAVVNRGLPQGSVVSPMLANLFLDEFDEFLLAQDLKLVRYADDFVILCKTASQAEQAFRLTEHKLAQLGLALDREKSRLTRFGDSFKFLGVLFWKDMLMLPFEKHIRERIYLSVPAFLPADLAKHYP